jgi:hypothetical protein
MFGIRGFGRRAANRGRWVKGGLGSALFTGAGVTAWRWWKNRRGNRESPPVEPGPRQSDDTGQASQGGGI